MSLLIWSAGLIGLLFGSFANVCIHRLPRHESIAFPPSHCPRCGHTIAPYDNIPVLSWLWLKGRCRHCGAVISWRYPLIELLMGAGWALMALLYGPTPALVGALLLWFLLLSLTIIDMETGLLPDMLTLPGVVLGIGWSFLMGYGVDAMIGAVAGYAVFWLVAKLFLLITGREGMGYGDFKLLAMLGAFMGWQALPFIILCSSLTGAVIGSVLLVLQRRGVWHAEIPFGPYLALAGMLWFVAGGDILAWYGGLIGLQP